MDINPLKKDLGNGLYSYTIPNQFYRFGKPYQTDYMTKGDMQGLSYRVSPEDEYELRANFGESNGRLTISILSPYIRGFKDEFSASQLELVSVNIDEREVVVRVKR